MILHIMSSTIPRGGNKSFLSSITMSDESEQDASVLGKRTRNKNDQPDEDMPENAPLTNEEDDDIGPMPMPEAATNGGSKKKRKGMYSAICLFWD